MEIPPAKPTDAEDVVWGLQTAETLWKRGERIDALVWLRRAAQAAGDANDDDRALELARQAAELTEWMANAASVPPAEDSDSIDISQDAVSIPPPPNNNAFDSAIPPPPAPWDVAPAISPLMAARASRPPPEPKTEPPPSPASSDEDEDRPSATSVPPAEKVHAGMFDPWADQSAQNIRAPDASAAPSPPAPLLPPPPAPPPLPVVAHVSPPKATRSSPPDGGIDEEVVTSVRPQSLQQPRSDAPPVAAVVPSAPTTAPMIPVAPITAPLPMPVAPPPRPSRPAMKAAASPAAPSTPGKPPPLPPRKPQTLPTKAPSIPVVVPPPAVVEEEATPISLTADAADVAMPDIDPYVPPPAELASAPPPVPVVIEAPAAPVAKKLDLENVESFADLPDDARLAFADAAAIHLLAEGDEIGGFALAYVLNGSIDVAATVVDAAAVRLIEGAVLRSRGTTEENVPIRMIAANGPSTVATWSDQAVADAFRTCPWVEEDLRSAADRVQTLVGITIGPLGERLDPSIREQIMSRLTMRPLIAKEIIVNIGEPVPGLLLVGIGELELVQDDKVTGIVGSGEFLFPTEVLGGGSAPATARAGGGGALVMFGDRRIAQELLVTCPPLLEVFAGM